MSFLALIHEAGGSTGDAVDAAIVLGPRPSAQGAEAVGEAVYEVLAGVGDHFHREVFFQVVEAPAEVTDVTAEVQDYLELRGHDTRITAADLEPTDAYRIVHAQHGPAEEGLSWSNEHGWTTRDQADVFTSQQKRAVLPLPRRGRWVRA